VGMRQPEKCLGMTLTCDLWPWGNNIFSNYHSHDEYLWQVSLKLHH